jgi:BlaI family penicillinase repressor
MHLTNAEEQIMRFLWKLEKAFIRDLTNEFSDPKPAQTTVITLLMRMMSAISSMEIQESITLW